MKRDAREILGGLGVLALMFNHHQIPTWLQALGLSPDQAAIGRNGILFALFVVAAIIVRRRF